VPEVGLHKIGALCFQYSAYDGGCVIEARVIQQVKNRACAPGFFVGCAESDFADSRLQDRASAHGAGLDSDKEGAALQTPVSDICAGLAYGRQFGVSQCVSVAVAGVVPLADYPPVLYNDAADWNLVFQEREYGLFVCQFHKEIVAHILPFLQNHDIIVKQFEK